MLVKVVDVALEKIIILLLFLPFYCTCFKKFFFYDMSIIVVCQKRLHVSLVRDYTNARRLYHALNTILWIF